MKRTPHSFHIFAAGSLLGAALFLAVSTGVPLLFAQDGATPAPTNTQTPAPTLSPATVAADQKCTQAMPALFDAEQKKFTDFMDSHFKNADPNSTLLQTGLDELSNYTARLTKIRDSFLITSPDQLGALDELIGCNKMLNNQILTAQQTFQSFVQQTAYTKKATAITEKLAAINGKLRTLNELLVAFNNYFSSFKNALPGFTKDCLKGS